MQGNDLIFSISCRFIESLSKAIVGLQKEEGAKEGKDNDSQSHRLLLSWL
jgi:hypothetical protein